MSTTAGHPRQFASDNCAGACEEALAALIRANPEHATSYGDDSWTRAACDAIRDFFGISCEVFFVFNGTAANSLALASLCQSYHSVICHETAHVEADECGAPEFFSNGTKLLLAGGADGKISPSEIGRLAHRRVDIHYPKPRVVSITQPTELGTVYSLHELAAIREAAQSCGLALHIDGARFFQAVVSAGCQPGELIRESGADVVCLGGTKLGMTAGEAVVFFNQGAAADFAFRCKQAGQLASKMRFLSAQWVGLLEDGAWRLHATHANEMATLLRRELSRIEGVTFPFPTQSNAVFVEAPREALALLRECGWKFYEFIGGAARFMCSWDTTPEDVSAISSDLSDAVRRILVK